MSDGAFDKKPGAGSLVQASLEAAPAAGPGKRTLTEQLGSGATSYTVRAGENLATIAAKLHTTPEALKAANTGKLKSYPTKQGGVVQGFQAGEVLSLPAGPAAREPAAPAPAAPVAPAEAAPAEQGWFSGALDRIGHTLHGAWDQLTGGGAPDTGARGTPSGGVPVTAEPQPHGAASTSAAPTSAAPTSAAPKAAPVSAPSPSPAAPTTADPPGTAPLAELTDAQRGQQLSTFHADELGTVDKFGMSKTGRDGAKQRGAWLSGEQIRKAGGSKSGQGFLDAADGLIDQTELSEDQGKIIESAKGFASSPKALTPAQEANAAINWGKAQLTLDGVSLNDDLKARLTRYVRFLAWAGLVSGPTTIGSVMRSPQMAHKLSVAWMFNLGANTASGSSLHKPANRAQLVANVTANGGTDKDGNAWLGATTVDELKAKKDDDAALFAYIKATAAPEANKVQTQPAIAAEGYKTAEQRHPNVLGGTSVSNHLLGEAVDMFPPFVLNNKFDPLIDAIAMYFGLWRAVKDNASSPEHWHYERLGMPPGAEHDDH